MTLFRYRFLLCHIIRNDTETESPWEFKHPCLLLVSTSNTSTGGGLLGVRFLASENWCGRVHFGGHSPEWRVLAKFSVQP